MNAPAGRPMTSAATGSKSAGKRGTVEVVELRPQVLVLLERELALDRPLAELAVLLAEPLGLGARSEEAVGPAVGVAERLRDALEPDRERPERRRAGRLDAAQRAVLVRAERERDEDERGEDEDAHDEPTAKRSRAARGNGRGDTPDGQAQRRRSRAALPGMARPV